MKSVSVAYFLQDDKSGEKRAPTAMEINYIIQKDIAHILHTHATKYSIEKVGVKNGKFVVDFKYNDNGIVKDLLLSPDDDGNYYIGTWGWRAVPHTASSPKKSSPKKRASPKKSSPKKSSPKKSSPKKSSPKKRASPKQPRCPNGTRRNKSSGKCVKK